ncbi:hypothetical protein [Halosimplex sp. TS25]|uniref:hypothetical protein n=1 Tax=Halosimplex rarum TaxID=3396619 RepID=UPI0039ED3FE6
MLIREIVAGGLNLVVGLVGVDGIAIGLLATVVAALWYLREAADAFVVLARYARVGSLIGFIVLVLYVAGTATGVVNGGDVAQVLKQFVGLNH